MPARDGSPVVDIAAVCAAPVLIMGMVGSLVWFLVDVLYAGAYPDRLLWCLSFFVFGAVLLARLTIQEGAARAAIYGVALGGATFLAMIRFVEYRNATLEAVGWAVSLGMMGLVWWLANRLAWDCTHFDDDRRASGRGLLAAAGIGSVTGAVPDEDDGDDPETAAKSKKSDSPGPLGWIERFQRYRAAQRKRPHTPGTWVLYFGLAALPMFALGQSLIPTDDLARRRTTLLEAAVFVGSGLGLLVTTSLLGLRKYLEQRNAPVSPGLTLGWLGLGGGLIVAFVLVGMLLPRPHSEIAWFGNSRDRGKSEVSASKNAAIRDNSAGKGDGAEGGQKETDPNAAKPGPDGKGDGGTKGSGGSGQKGDGSGGKDGDKSKSGDSTAKDGTGKEKESESKKSESKKSEPSSPAADEPEKSGKNSDGGSKNGPQEQAASALSKIGEALGALAAVLKWIVFALLAVAVVVAAVYFVVKNLAPFTDWAKNLLAWFRGLFAPRVSRTDDGDDESETPVGPVRPPPFAEFSNPFAAGSARRTPAELAAYTFAALDSWAWDRGHGRNPGETPAEFADRLAETFPELRAAARTVAELSVRGMYARTALTADAVKPLAAVWRLLERSPAPAVAN
ncbi:MAG: DUF4129 domain-containing protein [Fimbriiglobus sp.]